MNSSCLFPPNVGLLSDSVIGDVVQRARDPHKLSFITFNPLDVVRNGPGTHVIPPGNRRSAVLLKRKVGSVHSSPGPRAVDPSIQAMEQKNNYQRELRRRRQLRYRRKKDRLVETLKHENEQLRVEMRLLEQRRRAIHSSVPAQGTGWKAVASYFHIFRHGCQLSSGLTNANSKTPDDQYDFVQAAMAPNVVYNNTVRGVEALMDAWETFSLWFQGVELVLDRLDQDTPDSLVATVTASFTVSERTLQNVFPHLLDDTIADKLQGQRIVMRGKTCFEWDCIYSRITSIRDEFDLLTPMLRVLGNLGDVATLFEMSIARLDFSPSDLAQEKQD